MAELLFGTGGTPRSSKQPSTVSGIERIAELGLGCMEMEFVQGVRMSEALAEQVRGVATRQGIKLTAHAPYFINLNAREPEKIRASQYRILQTARVAKLCGAVSIVFHPAFYLGDAPEKAYQTVKKYLKETVDELKKENNRVWIRPELMGKTSQFGTLDEIINLSLEIEQVAPCIDFAHCHARTDAFNTYPEFASILEKVATRLGRAYLENLHMHISGIAYGPKGERNHLNLKESDLRYTELMRALKDCGAGGMVICESPNLEEDALLMQKTYRNLPGAA